MTTSYLSVGSPLSFDAFGGAERRGSGVANVGRTLRSREELALSRKTGISASPSDKTARMVWHGVEF